MTDLETVQAYTQNVVEYAQKFAREEPDEDLSAFIKAMPPRGRVLDYGCGPGNSAAIMRDAGLITEATDATQAMADIARDQYGIPVRVEPFEALDVIDRYDGIWANFSLLHATRDAFPGHLLRIRQALKSGGLMHLGMKIGAGEKRDHLGRFYTYYSEDELKDHVSAAGMMVAGLRLGEGDGLAGTVEKFGILTAHA